MKYQYKIKELKSQDIIKLIIIISLLIIIPSLANAEIKTSNYIISENAISQKVSTGVITSKNISITNLRANPIIVKFGFSGNISEFADMAPSNITIEPNEQKNSQLSLFGRSQIGIINGTLNIQNDINEIIPITLEVVQEEHSKGTLMMELTLLQDRVPNGQNLNYKIDLFNLIGNKEFNITLLHKIERLEQENDTTGENIGHNNWNMTDEISLKNSNSLLRSFTVPKKFDMGDYSITVEAKYLGNTALVKGLFIVERPLYAMKVGGVMPVWSIFTFLSSAVIIYFLYLFFKHQADKKKRFHAKVEYKLLPQEGDRTLWMGYIAETKHKFYLDMDNLTVHSIVAGSTGGGKSIAAQDIVEEALLKGVAVAVFDPTAQWSGMLRKLADKKFLSIYPQFGMDPAKDPKAFPGNIKAIKDHRELVDIFKYLKPGEIQVFTTNTLDPRNYDSFVANMIRQIFHSKLEEFRGLKYLVVFDEIHRILPKFGGTGEGFTQIERSCREFRKWGIGIVLISQVLSDFVGEIKANINTQIQMKTRDEGDLNRIKMQYGEEFIQALVKAPVGSGMVQNSAYNRGQPFYVTFRPILHSVARLTDDELDMYNQYNSIVEDLEFQLDQLDEMKQDVFDLKLELKLSKDKIKSGNFNMVKIYLEGLTPRIQKIWDKLGKAPKKLEIKLVSDAEMKAELEAAKAAKAKIEAEKKSQEAAAPQVQQEEKEVPMDPEMVKENLAAVKKLLGAIEEGIVAKDWFAINDRVMEIQSIPLPKDKKVEVKKQLEDVQKRVEDAKNPQPQLQAQPAQVAAAQQTPTATATAEVKKG